MTDATEFDSLRDVRENAKAIRGMIAFQKWKEGVEAQAMGRMADVLKALPSMDSILEQEYKKGEVAGIELAVKYWGLMIDLLDEEIKRRISETEPPNDDRKSSP